MKVTDLIAMPLEDRDPKPSKPSIGGYEILSELGRGGMGVVYRARQASLNRSVALKILSGEFAKDDLTRFLAEATTAARLQHPNIVHVYEVGEDEGVPYFSMEHIQGGTLADHVRGRELSPQEAATLMLPLARAVQFAHEQGVVHRDLKPGNVLMDTENVPKVVDFGIAKRLDEDARLTKSGMVVGTPIYMAPEQAAGRSRSVGPAADIYSLGAILYELLTGRPPFLPEESDTSLALRVVTEEPISPAFHRPGLPRDIEAICMMCLQKEPKDRYAYAGALAEDLRRFLHDEPILAKPPTRIKRTVKWVKRHPWRTVGYAALFMALGAGLLRLWQWEMYERHHVEYAHALDFRHMQVVPVGKVKSEDTSKLGLYLKMTRQGRVGRIIQVQALNPRGRPAFVRELQSYSVLPSWLEGSSGLGDSSLPRRETVRVDFKHDRGEMVKMTAYDRNDLPTWQVGFVHNVDAEKPGTIRARFYNDRGFDDLTTDGASFADFEQDAAGWHSKIHFLDNAGKPARNGEGVYAHSIERDKRGRVVRVSNLDKEGKPMANQLGIIGLGYTWDEQDRTTGTTFLREDGEKTDWRGLQQTATDYDAAGNVVEVRSLDAKGKLAHGNHVGWSVQRERLNERGEIEERTFLSADEKGNLTPHSRQTLSYDTSGYPSEIKLFAGGGLLEAFRAYRFDDRGNILEEKEHEADGSVKLWKRYTLNKRGQRTLTEALDSEGKPTARLVQEYEDERLVSDSYEDGRRRAKPTDGGYSRVQYEYDSKGVRKTRVVYSGYRFPNLAATHREEVYNKFGKVERETWFSLDDKNEDYIELGPEGWAVREISFTEDGRIQEETYKDDEDKPTRHQDGHKRIVFETATDSSVVLSKTYEGYDMEKLGYAALRKVVGKNNLYTEEVYLDQKGKIILGPEGWASVRYRYDEKKNRVREDYLDAEGKPTNGEQGWASLRFKYNNNQDVEREEYFDASGQMGYGQKGCHRIIYDWQGGVMHSYHHEGYDPKRFENYRSDTEVFREGKIVRRMTTKYWREDGQPARGQHRLNSRQSIRGHTYTVEFDDLDRKTREVLEDCDPNDTGGAPAWRVTSTYPNDESRRARTAVEEALSEKLEPLATLPDDPARRELTINEEGRRTRWVHANLPAAWGFARREMDFDAEEKLSAVRLLRADGSEVKEVRVIIQKIAKEAQPRAAMLRVGDQLLSANGQKVSSAMAFTLGPAFPGGSLEVLRDGKTIRIDGFEPGKIGMVLKDLAK